MSRYIARVITSAFQGRDLDIVLGKVNLVVADNATGKTAIGNAIQLALYGHVPRLGKSEAACMDLASGDALSVQAVFSDNLNSLCEITRNSEGSCHRDFAPAFDTPLVLLDPQDYFRRTEAERLRYVFERVDLRKAGYDEQALLDSIKSVEAMPRAIADLFVVRCHKELTESIKRRTEIKQTVQEWMAGLIDRLKKTKKAKDDAAKRQAAVMQSLRPDGPAPENVTAEHNRLQAEWDQLNTKLGAARQTLAQATPLKDR